MLEDAESPERNVETVLGSFSSDPVQANALMERPGTFEKKPESRLNYVGNTRTTDREQGMPSFRDLIAPAG